MYDVEDTYTILANWNFPCLGLASSEEILAPAHRQRPDPRVVHHRHGDRGHLTGSQSALWETMFPPAAGRHDHRPRKLSGGGRIRRCPVPEWGISLINVFPNLLRIHWTPRVHRNFATALRPPPHHCNSLSHQTIMAWFIFRRVVGRKGISLGPRSKYLFIVLNFLKKHLIPLCEIIHNQCGERNSVSPKQGPLICLPKNPENFRFFYGHH